MAVVKTVGRGGQIALGKAYAGRQVLVEQLDPGVWLVKLGEFIPDNERWLHAPGVKANLEEAIAWVELHPAAEKATRRSTPTQAAIIRQPNRQPGCHHPSVVPPPAGYLRLAASTDTDL